jgi:peptidoglycan/LPS O-acetylase OafA/YrhL
LKRISELDGVRGVAILAVFAHHSLHVKLLWAGVDLFFILSGFLITGVLLGAKQRPMGEYFRVFYARRARRILVPYLIALLVLSLFFGFAWRAQWFFYLGLMNFLPPLGLPEPNAFGPFWSLAVEEQFYLVWPFAVYLLSERRLARFACSLFVAAPLLRGLCHFQTDWAVYMLTPFRVDLLATGALLCLAYRNDGVWMRRWGAGVGLVLTCIGAAGLLLLSHFGVTTYGNTRTGNVLIYECTLLTCSGLILWALSGRYTWPLRWGALRYVGKISYSMYLIHLGAILLLGERLSPLAAAGAAFAVTLGYAVASWHLVERRLLRA